MADPEKGAEQKLVDDPILGKVPAAANVVAAGGDDAQTQAGENDSKTKETELDYQTRLARERQSELDKFKSETKEAREVYEVLTSRPDVMKGLEKLIAGESVVQQPAVGQDDARFNPEEYDPYAARTDPKSPSYEHRVTEDTERIQKVVLGVLDKLQEKSLQKQTEQELRDKFKFNEEQSKEFMDFVNQPKEQVPLEVLVKVYKEAKGIETSDQQTVVDSVKRAQGIPQTAGILQGGDVSAPDEDAEMVKRVLQHAQKRGSLGVF